MSRSATPLLAAVVAALCVSIVNASKCPSGVQVADNFQLQYYEGMWYEIADSKAFKDLFEKDLQCTFANYTLEDGYVAVDNSGRKGSPTGKVSRAIGKAKQVDGAKLEVSFGGPYGPYWIIDLIGEASSGYAVSLVWSCSDVLDLFSFKNLWVLSRTPQLPEGVTLESLYAKAEAMGINVTALDMIPTPQPANCEY